MGTRWHRRSIVRSVIREECPTAIPPILSSIIISLWCRHQAPPSATGVTRVAVSAAMRVNEVVQTPCGSYQVAHPTHLAPHQSAQSPSRRYCYPRWCALTAPFHPLPDPLRAIGGTALCCRLASRRRYRRRAPAYGFAGRPVWYNPHEESGSSSGREASDDLPSDTWYHTTLLLRKPVQHCFGAVLEKAQITAA